MCHMRTFGVISLLWPGMAVVISAKNSQAFGFPGVSNEYSSSFQMESQPPGGTRVFGTGVINLCVISWIMNSSDPLGGPGGDGGPWPMAAVERGGGDGGCVVEKP